MAFPESHLWSLTCGMLISTADTPDHGLETMVFPALPGARLRIVEYFFSVHVEGADFEHPIEKYTRNYGSIPDAKAGHKETVKAVEAEYARQVLEFSEAHLKPLSRCKCGKPLGHGMTTCPECSAINNARSFFQANPELREPFRRAVEEMKKPENIKKAVDEIVGTIRNFQQIARNGGKSDD